METVFLLFFSVLAVASGFGLPVRLIRIRLALAAWTRLRGVIRWISAAGLLLLIPAASVWLACAYAAYKAFLDPGTPRIWGMSEIGVSLTALILVYLLAELLLLPITLEMRRGPP